MSHSSQENCEKPDSEDSIWSYVTANKKARRQDGDEEGSTVMVSREPSEWSFDIRSIRSSSPPPPRILWPPTLPWFQFQARCLQAGISRPKSEPASPGMCTSALITTVASRALANIVQGQVLAATPSAATFERAVAEVAKSVPEIYEGQHAEKLKLMLGDDPHQARLVALEMLVYRVSNNLVEDEDEESDDKDSDCSHHIADSKHDRIVSLFRDIGFPRDSWEDCFSEKHGPSGRAFAEKLFEAALNTRDLEIVEALLNSGIDPDQPVVSEMNGYFMRPIQLAGGSLRNFEMAELLIKAGADVDGTTPEYDMPALHGAADGGSMGIVQLLVEGGADIYRAVPQTSLTWEPIITPLGFAASHDPRLFDDLEDHESTSSSTSESGDTPEGAESYHGLRLTVLRYLLSFHQKGTRPHMDRLIIQDALLIAADHSQPDMLEELHRAGGDVNRANFKGITPLMVAASQRRGDIRVRSYLVDHDAAMNSHFAQQAVLRISARQRQEDTRVASYLLQHGAAIDNPPGQLSALHIAACHGHLGMVAFLIENGADVNRRGQVRDFHKRLLGDDFHTATPPNMIFTPLQLSLHREPENLYSRNSKTDETAIALLESGAELAGGEVILAAQFLSRRLMFALLFQCGENPNKKYGYRHSALQTSLMAFRGRRGKEESVSDILLDCGAVIEKGTMYLAFAAGDIRLVEYLANTRPGSLADVGPRGESLLEGAIISQSTGLIGMALMHAGGTSLDPAALCAAIHCEMHAGPSTFDGLLAKFKRRVGVSTPRSNLFLTTALSMAVRYAANEQLPLSTLEKRIATLPPAGSSLCLVPFSPGSYASYFGSAFFGAEYDKAGWWHRPNLLRCSPLVPVLASRASRDKRWPAARVLLRAGYRPDPLSLLITICNDTSSEVEELIRHGASVNQPFRYDVDTPLQRAIRLGDISIVRVLLQHGANVNDLAPVFVPMYDGYQQPNAFRPRSALQMAVEKGHLAIIDLLLDAGADVNGPISLDGGATALQCAASKGYLGIAKRLIEAGAHVDCPRAERYGRTALEAAAEMGRLDMVQFLLESGARTGRDDGKGSRQFLRAIGLARRNGHLTVAGLLEGRRELSGEERRCVRWLSLYDVGSFDFPEDEDMVVSFSDDDDDDDDDDSYLADGEDDGDGGHLEDDGESEESE